MKLRIITPDSSLDEDCNSFIFTGEKGDINIMNNHADYLEAIRPSILKIVDKNNKVTKSYSLNNGMLRFYHHDNLCIVYTETIKVLTT